MTELGKLEAQINCSYPRRFKEYISNLENNFSLLQVVLFFFFCISKFTIFSQDFSYNKSDSVCLQKGYEVFLDANEDRYFVEDHKAKFIADQKGNQVIDLSPYYIGFYESFHDNRMAVKDEVSQKMGYIDRSGKLAIPFIFKTASDFRNGFAPVKKGGYTALIDTTGKVVIPFEYEGLCSPMNGLIPAQKGGYWGLIDWNQNVVVPFTYELICNYGHDLFSATKDGKDTYLDSNGKEFIDHDKYDQIGRFKYRLATVTKGKKSGFINTKGKLVIDLHYDYCYSFKYGFSQIKKDGKYGVIDTLGNSILNIEYDKISIYEHNITAKKNSKERIYNHKGVLVTEEHFDKITQTGPCILVLEVTKKNKKNIYFPNGTPFFSDFLQDIEGFGDGLVLAKQDDLWNYYDIITTEKVLGPYKKAKEFIHGRAIVDNHQGSVLIDKQGKEISAAYSEIIPLNKHFKFIQNGKWGVIDRSGKLVIDPIYEKIEHIRINTLQVKKDNKYGLIDFKKTLLPIVYDDIKFNNSRCGYIEIIQDDKIGFVNLLGKILLKPSIDKVKWCWLGILKVSIGDKYGLLNKDMTFIAPPIYEELSHFRNGTLCGVKLDGKWGFINRQGNTIIAPQYDEIHTFTYAHNVAAVKKNDQWHLINTNGQSVGDDLYDELKMVGGDNYYQIKKGNSWGLINKKGQVKIDFKYTSLKYLTRIAGERYWLATLNGKFGVVNEKGQVKIPFEHENIKHKDSHFIVQKNNLYGVLSKNGVPVVPIKYGEYVRNYYSNLWVFKSPEDNLREIAISSSGLIIGKDHTWTSISKTLDIFKVQTEDGWGMIDSLGRVIISPKYLAVDYFRFGDWGKIDRLGPLYFNVKNEKGRAILDSLGNPITDFKYTTLDAIKNTVLVRAGIGDWKTRQYGILDFQGKNILPIYYSSIGSAYNGFISIEDQEERCGFANTKGELIVSPQYHKCNPYEDGHSIVHLKSKKGVIDVNGDVIIPIQFNELKRYRQKESDKWIVSIEDKEFIINLKKQCIENCPEEFFLTKIGLTLIK